MSTPVELKTRAQIVNARCIDMCREILAKAESGEIESVFVVTFSPGGDYEVMISETMHTLKKIGCLSRLKHDYLSAKD